ncbi:MAG: beta-N-acetylhexosaminidase [Desulfobacterales bacterium]|nr:MAG: beta-N-acetylhexosaminidase [Desulfobacterales bacterium]
MPLSSRPDGDPAFPESVSEAAPAGVPLPSCPYPVDDPVFIRGQRLMIGFDGTALTPFLDTMIRRWLIGGVILFQRNIETPRQVGRLIADMQAAAEDAGLPPLFIAVDQEGGTAARLRPPEFTSYGRCPGGQPAITTDGEAADFAHATARELRSLGFNMNMAPVLDVVPTDMPGIMASRAFPGGAADVARLGVRMIRAFQDSGILAVAKHFPGIGRTTLDSHIDLPVMPADRESIRSRDLPPFAAAVDAGVAGIMLSHISYPEIDPDFPASRSPIIAQTWLRRDLGFSGLSLTDDLDMGAVRRHGEFRAVIRHTAAAGLDQILICHQSPDMEIALAELKRYWTGHPEQRPQFQASLSRILHAKKKLEGWQE